MAIMNEDKLTITLTGKKEFIPYKSFLSAVDNTIALLRDLDSSISGRSSGSVEWQISSVSMNSPLAFTVFADAGADIAIGRDILDACTHGLRQIESSSDRIPRYFTINALEHASKLVAVLNDGIDRISIATPWDRPVLPSQRISLHVNRLLPKEHEELGSFEGVLKTLSIAQSFNFAIWDVISNRRIECRFAESMLEEAHANFGKRVSVYGIIRYSRTGKPQYIRVENMYQLREQNELPQAKDLESVSLAKDSFAYAWEGSKDE